MTESQERREGGQTGNDNARGRRGATYVPPIEAPVPLWLHRARLDFAREEYRRRSRNWRPDPTTGRPSVAGRTIHVDPKAPSAARPIRVDIPGRPPRWAATAVEARGIVEADFAREENAKSAQRRAGLALPRR